MSKTESQHTPGPWDLIRSSDQRRDGFIRCSRKLNGAPHGLAVGQAFKHGFQYDEYEANAHLIASAPELLEACREIIDGMIDGPNATQKNVTAYAVHKVRAAIAKAEGRE